MKPTVYRSWLAGIAFAISSQLFIEALGQVRLFKPSLHLMKWMLFLLIYLAS